MVYVVRHGDRNDELKMSLRSLGNLPHNRVFIAGHCPRWVKNVTAIPVRSVSDKHTSIENNLRAALQHPELGHRCVFFNDDFYVMEPIESVPVMHGGSIEGYTGKGALKQRMFRTRLLIDNMGQMPLLTYDGQHVPFPIVRDEVVEALGRNFSSVLWRTWYGNMFSLGGRQVSDVKSRDGTVIPGPFMSSSQRSFPILRPYLEDTLPRSSPYV